MTIYIYLLVNVVSVFFYIHVRWSAMQRLNFRFLRQQGVTLRDTNRIDNVLAWNDEMKTTFLAWMEANIKYPKGRKLTFCQFLEAFMFNYYDAQEWHPRKNDLSIGRLSYFPPGGGELDYTRLLLNVQVGAPHMMI